jgi:transposase
MRVQPSDVLVGLDGLRVVEVRAWEDHLQIVVESRFAVAACPRCGVVGECRVRARPAQRVRDVPFRGWPTFLVWRKRRFSCSACGRSSTESHPEIPPRARATERLRRFIYQRLRFGQAHAELARTERLSRYRVWQAWQAGSAGELAERAAIMPRRLTIDEISQRKDSAFATVVGDADQRRVIDVIEGRTTRGLEQWLAGQYPAWRAGIEAVSIDCFDAYRTALRRALPNAVIVADGFHLVKAANRALDLVRRDVQRHHDRPGWVKPVFRARRLLTKAHERLTPHQRQRLHRVLADHPDLAEAWRLTEQLRHLLAAPDLPQATARLDRLLDTYGMSRLEPFTQLVDRLAEWRTEILNRWIVPTSNGYAEGVSNKIKTIKRRAYGLPTFTNFRHRILICCG